MSEEKKIRLNPSEAMDQIRGMGNVSYLWEFIDYFEDKLEEEIAPYKVQYKGIDITKYAYLKCPNFSAWLRIYVELICNKALTALSRAEDCQRRISEYHFKSGIEQIIKIAEAKISRKRITNNEFDKMTIAIKMVVELRHTLQHGGIPNILRDVSFKDINDKNITSMMIPQNYKETKEIFQNANRLIELLPKRIMTIRKNGEITLEKKDKD